MAETRIITREAGQRDAPLRRPPCARPLAPTRLTIFGADDAGSEGRVPASRLCVSGQREGVVGRPPGCELLATRASHGGSTGRAAQSPVRKASSVWLTVAGASCWTQWPAPCTMVEPRKSEQAAPGDSNRSTHGSMSLTKSCSPAMKHEGWSSEAPTMSASAAPSSRIARYRLKAPTIPVRRNVDT